MGKSAAWRVSVLLTGVEKYNEEARRNEVEEWFMPVELTWCHGIGSQLQALNPHSTIYFDLDRRSQAEISGETRMALIRPMPHNSFRSESDRCEAIGLCSYQGKYQLRIQVTAANAGPVEAWFHLRSLPGWSDNLEDLIRDGHMRIAHLGQRPQSLVGAVEEHFRREMSIDSGRYRPNRMNRSLLREAWICSASSDEYKRYEWEIQLHQIRLSGRQRGANLLRIGRRRPGREVNLAKACARRCRLW